MSSHLTPEQRNERAALALRTAQEIAKHTEAKVTWIKGWKLTSAKRVRLAEAAGLRIVARTWRRQRGVYRRVREAVAA